MVKEWLGGGEAEGRHYNSKRDGRTRRDATKLDSVEPMIIQLHHAGVMLQLVRRAQLRHRFVGSCTRSPRSASC